MKPPRLAPGMTIGVIAPSGAIRDERLEIGIQRIEERGYRVVRGSHLYDRHGYLAGADISRADDFNEMFARQDIHAIFCARGGYGCCRMVDHVDWDMVRLNPKVFAGYSDITTIHLMMDRYAGYPTFHGLVVASHGGRLSDSARDCFWNLVENPQPFGELPGRGETLVGGKVRGRIAGGCLSILAAAVGTPEQPDFEGRLVLIEDIGEPVYRLDRYLVQLARAGVLSKAAGFIVGSATGWRKLEREEPVISPNDIWREHIASLGKPAITQFPFGHERNPLTLPLGVMATLDADSGAAVIEEAAVI